MPRTTANIQSVIDGERRYALIEGDCLHELQRVPDDCAQLVLCDPPYGVRWCGMGNRQKAIANDEFPFIWWLYDARRILVTGGALVCFCNWRTEAVWKTAIEAAGLTIRSKFIWSKGRPGMGDTTAQMAPSYEVAWFATNGRFAFPDGRPRDLLEVPIVPPRSRLHTTEKPVDLLKYLIAHVTEPGDLVLDPTCGSGSAGDAAIAAGRRFLGIEYDADNAQIARERLRAAALSSRRRNRLACSRRPIHFVPRRRAVA